MIKLFLIYSNIQFTGHDSKEMEEWKNSPIWYKIWKILHSRGQDQNCLLIKMQLKAILRIILIRLGIFKLVGKDCGNLAIGLWNSSVLDLVSLMQMQLEEMFWQTGWSATDRVGRWLLISHTSAPPSFLTLTSTGRDLANIWLIMRHLLAFLVALKIR